MKTASWQKIKTPKMREKRNERRRRRRTDPLLQGPKKPKKPRKGRFTMHAAKRALPEQCKAAVVAANDMAVPTKLRLCRKRNLREYIRALWNKLKLAEGGA